MSARQSYMRLGSRMAALVIACGIAQSAAAQTVLIDIGSTDSFRGLSVSNPDSNGNHWNSVWSGAFYPDVADITGAPTSIDFGFSSATGTDSYNGPAGPTDSGTLATDVLNTDIDSAALGNLGGALEGAFDFYVTSTIEIQGLDPSKTYNLTFYGSHKFSEDSTTVYEVYSDANYDTVVASASLNVQDAAMPWLHNRDTVATINGLSPQAGNTLYIYFHGLNIAHAGYLNAMQIEVVPEPTTLLLLSAGGLLLRRKRR